VSATGPCHSAAGEVGTGPETPGPVPNPYTTCYLAGFDQDSAIFLIDLNESIFYETIRLLSPY
jgi:hypothetical protein